MATLSIREFQAQSIANLVWAFAQVRIYCEPLFNVIMAEGARGCAFEMEPQAVANTAWALAHLQAMSQPMMFLKDEVCSRAVEFQIPELASAIWAFGELHLLDESLFAAVSFASQNRGPPKPDERSLAVMILSALARLEDPKLALQYFSHLEDSGAGSAAKGLGPLLAHSEQLASESSLTPSEILLQLRPATGHAAVTAAALHLAESGEAAKALKLVEHLASSGQRGLWHQIWVACGGQIDDSSQGGQKGQEISLMT